MPRRRTSHKRPPCAWPVLLIAALVTAASAQLHIDGEAGPAPEEVVLQQMGQANAEVVITVPLRKGEQVTSYQLTDIDGEIITATAVDQVDDFEAQHTNFTLTFDFEGKVGTSPYTFSVQTSRDNSFDIKGSYKVAGISLLDADGNLVSGLSSNLDVGDYTDQLSGPRELTAIIVPTDDSVSVSEILFDGTVEFEAPSSAAQFQQQVEYDESCVLANVDTSGQLREGCGLGYTEDGSKFYLQLSPYRVGEGQFNILMTHPSLTDPVTGEATNVILPVVIATEPVPPVVFYATTIFADYYGGEEHPLDVFNAGKPPRSETDSVTGGGFVLADSNNAQWSINTTRTNEEMQDGAADQVVYLITVPQPKEDTTEYSASATVEFSESSTVEAVILATSRNSDGAILIEYQKPVLATELATDLSEEVASSNETTILNVDIQMDQYDPASYSNFKQSQTCASLLETVGSIDREHCGLSDVLEPDVFEPVSFSARQARQNTDGLVARYRVAVGTEDWEADAEKIQESIESGQLARDLNVNPSTVRLFAGRLPAPPTASPTATATPAPREVTAGVAAWSIALIAILTAVALVVLVGCCLFILYKRDDDDETEEASSSEGDGLGVIPRPDDAMYQQAIVRDTFGRGEVDENAFPAAETEDGVPAEYPAINS